MCSHFFKDEKLSVYARITHIRHIAATVRQYIAEGYNFSPEYLFIYTYIHIYVRMYVRYIHIRIHVYTYLYGYMRERAHLCVRNKEGRRIYIVYIRELKETLFIYPGVRSAETGCARP